MPTSPAAPDASPVPAGLAALEARLRQDLAWLALPPPAWVIPREHEGQAVWPVAIIGGGMAGLTIQAALRWLGIEAPCLDQSPTGFEGPWATTARMETLRSPKQLTGPALGLPSLTFRAWFEAQFGLAAWDALDKIPRLQWMDYLRWYRQVLDLDVRNAHHVRLVRPLANGLVALDITRADGTTYTQYARHVVLATGRDGLGGPSVPAAFAALPRHLWAHSSDPLDFTALRGRHVAVVGGGASATDVAATALEAGADRVDLLIRRPDFPRVNKGKGAGNPGLVHGFSLLPDEWRWRIRHYLNQQQVPPPRGSTQRVSRHPNAHFHFSSPVTAVHADGDRVVLKTPQHTYTVDFLFVATGFRIDWAQRPEFAAIAPYIRTWKDRHPAPADDPDPELDDCPDLGPAFEFQPRTPDACPGLGHVHCFSYPAALSHGTVSGDIPAISDGAQALARQLAGRLYAADIDTHYARLQAYDEPELLGDEWTPAADQD